MISPFLEDTEGDPMSNSFSDSTRSPICHLRVDEGANLSVEIGDPSMMVFLISSLFRLLIGLEDFLIF